MFRHLQGCRACIKLLSECGGGGNCLLGEGQSGVGEGRLLVQQVDVDYLEGGSMRVAGGFQERVAGW